MKQRKLLSLLLALMMTLSSLCVSALAADGDHNLKAEYDPNTGSVTITADGLTATSGYLIRVMDNENNLVAMTGAKQTDGAIKAGIASDEANIQQTKVDGGVYQVSLIGPAGTAVDNCKITVKSASGSSDSPGSNSNTGGNTSGGASGAAGGGAVANTTTVEVSKASNGSLKVSSTTAKAGDRVTVTLTPNSGYEADTLTVKDKSGATVTATRNANGTYAFTMPGTGKLPVSVSATFKAIETKPVTPTPTATPVFTDVNANAYYADAVKWAVEKGITNGTGTNTFSPDASCTRGQVVTFLWRAAGSPEPTSASTSFADLGSASAYYYKAVLWAVENKITNGTSDTAFSPNAIVNRGQVVTFLYRYEKASSTAGDAFNDVAASAYYAPAVNWAVANKITNGTGARTFSPDADCTRGQIVTFLYRDMVK